MLHRDQIIRALKRELEKTPKVSISQSEASPTNLDFLFIYQPPQGETERKVAVDLIEKMGAALKLEVGRWASRTVENWNLEDLSRSTQGLNARNLVLLGDPKFEIRGTHCIRIASVSDLLRSPDRKREAWEKLKAALLAL